jgi:NADH-quinone oxidoreductase subunit N
VLNATISLYYYLLVVKAMFINKNDMPIATLTSTYYEKASFALCLVGIIAIGFVSGVYEYIRFIVSLILA